MQRSSIRGMAAVEFVLAVPAFLLLILLCIEFTLMQIDRHLLTNALFSGTRLVLGTALSESGSYESVDPATKNAVAATATLNPMRMAKDATYYCSEKTIARLRRHIAFKMAPGAMSPHELASGLGFDIPFSLPFDSIPLLSAGMKRLLLGYGPALLQVNIEREGCILDARGVTLSVTWRRVPRVPYAGTVVWALYMLGTFNEKTGKALQLSLDDTNFGVKATSPALAESKERLRDVLGVMKGAGFDVGAIANAVTKDPVLSGYLGKAFGTLATKGSDWAGADGIVTDALERADELGKRLSAQESVLTAMLHSVPPSLRIVPMERSMHLAWGTTSMQRHAAGKWEVDGANLMVAPYTADGSAHGGTAEVRELWAAWHKALAQENFDTHPGEK